jgi:hypothetical protein
MRSDTAPWVQQAPSLSTSSTTETGHGRCLRIVDGTGATKVTAAVVASPECEKWAHWQPLLV